MLKISQRPVIIGILNLTPDSFSDGSPQSSVAVFLQRARSLIEEGAAILDVGGESTRPQADYISLEEERRRVIPFLTAFRQEFPNFPLSLDTKKYALAKEALAYRISVLNDVSFLSDTRFLDLVGENDCHYVLMHARGDQKTMMDLTAYADGLIPTMKKEIGAKLSLIDRLGLAERVILDLGFGFAKTLEQCVELMENLHVWQDYPQPKLIGLSRKRFLQKYIGECAPFERDQITAELNTRAYEHGFQFIRTHNVKLTRSHLLLTNPWFV